MCFAFLQPKCQFLETNLSIPGGVPYIYIYVHKPALTMLEKGIHNSPGRMSASLSNLSTVTQQAKMLEHSNPFNLSHESCCVQGFSTEDWHDPTRNGCESNMTKSHVSFLAESVKVESRFHFPLSLPMRVPAFLRLWRTLSRPTSHLRRCHWRDRSISSAQSPPWPFRRPAS